MSVSHIESLEDPVLDAVRHYRLNRLCGVLAAADVDVAVLSNPVSLQFAIDFEEYQSFQSRIPTFSVMVWADGHVASCGSYMQESPLVGEYLPSLNLSHFDGGLDLTDRARQFADLLRSRFTGRARVALERFDASVVQAFLEVGFEVVDAGGLMEKARSIKSPEEVSLIRRAVEVAGLGIDAMKRWLRPGVTENEVWAQLHAVNIAHGGRWIDGRMLASGPRTNPWLQEATDRVIQAGDMVSFDTDMVGPHGYFADVSRACICGDGPATAAQRDLHRRAQDEIAYNMDMVRPGLGFREFSEKAFRQPPPFRAHRYPCLAHGAGMSDEWPKIAHWEDWPHDGYDGEIEAGMVMCIESFVGSETGGEGVKLEQQVLVTETGTEILSTVPFDEALS